jgi:putative DNA modification/repair radical SAM protein
VAAPSLRRKLEILADAAKYDASCASSGSVRQGVRGQMGSSDGTGICHSYTPDGRCVSLLKVLLTNHCVYDCRFCVNRASSSTPRARFTVEEVVALTLDFYRRNYIEGLFLSSGIVQSADHTMEQLVAVARRLRVDHAFNGYIHLKAVPGASRELLVAAGRLADRLSANIELPRQDAMSVLATYRQEAREERRRSAAAPDFAPAGQSTQMVVGATDASDRDILATASQLYGRHRLKRIYYSAFSPIPGSDPRLPAAAPPLVREHRLYQADWLMRYYGFDASELTSPDAPDLSLDVDPKTAWALRHRERFPVDLDRAPREAILRVPGIGVRSADALLRVRRHHAIRLEDLPKLRISLRRALPFVRTSDHNPALAALDRADLAARVAAPRQLELFEARRSARAGEL